MKQLTQEEFKRAVTSVVSALIEKLEQTREPWRRITPESHADDLLVDTGIGSVLGAHSGLGFDSAGRLVLSDNPIANANRQINLKRQQIEQGDYSGGISEARKVLSSLGIQGKEDSPLFRELSLEMLKLDVVRETIKRARAAGDYQTETEFLEAYRKAGYAPAAEAVIGPTISEAWTEYAAEKSEAKPTPEWNAKTALGQAAIFADFREIVGDIRAGQITRDVMLLYRNALARLPKNRRKHYPNKTIAELLQTDTPTNQLPAARTIQEKLVQIGAFIKWCRETKGYLRVDPMIGVHVEAESQSYAPFAPADLRRLFNSKEYQRAEHAKSWHFWVPLVALYSGARQAEIGQLAVRDVLEDDGIWTFVITDAGDDQKVKTRAGIRKVPVSSKLIALGFLDYVQFVKDRGESRLFPDLPKGKHGWGDKISRWFNDTYKKNCGIEPDPTGRRKVFHSFRHTAITKALSRAQTLLAHAQQVFGHEKSLLGETATYVAPFPVETLAPVIEALDYGLNHSQYKDSWRKYVADWPKSSASPSVSPHVLKARKEKHRTRPG